MSKEIPLSLKINAFGNSLQFMREINQMLGKSVGATKHVSKSMKELGTSVKEVSKDFKSVTGNLKTDMKSISRSFKDTTKKP